jgi:transposase
MPVNILNLPGYRVADVREAEREYHVKVETITPVGRCPACHGTDAVGHGRVEILVHDLPVHGKQVGVYVDARRLRCQGCGKTFMETLPGVNDARRMTQRLVKWVGERSLRYTFTSIADEIGVAEGTIRNVFADHVAELERTVKFQTPQWMGIDEIHIIKRPRAVFSNLKNVGVQRTHLDPCSKSQVLSAGVLVFAQLCGSNSPKRLLGQVGSLVSTSLR